MGTITELVVVDIDGDEMDIFDVDTVPDIADTVVVEGQRYEVKERTWTYFHGAGELDRTSVTIHLAEREDAADERNE
jgi:hypothetical protein